MKKNDRIIGLDVCRSIACMGVVMAHTVMLFWDFDPSSPVWRVYNAAELILRISIPLFFMISGAIVLNRPELDSRRHLKKIGLYLGLFYIWSLIFAVLDRTVIHAWSDESFWSLFAGGYYHLWFLPSFALCYAALPVLHSAVNGEKADLRFPILLFVLFVVLKALPSPPEPMRSFVSAYRFEDLRYLGYMLLGWWLYNNRLSAKQLAVLGVCAAVSAAVFARLNLSASVSACQASTLYYSETGLSTALGAGFIFCLCCRISSMPPFLERTAAAVSRLSLGIYLTHVLFIDLLRGTDLTFASGIILVPAIFVGTFAASMLLTLCISKLPVLRRLVGISRK